MMTSTAKQMVILATTVIVSVFFLSACDKWMVGAPCKPETDNGTYYPELKSDTYSLETRSVQCTTGICVTKTRVRDGGQQKYSFCSCRCRDKDGHSYDRNSDKYDDLCECPSGSYCSPDVVNNNIEQIPDTIKGSYCLPGCINPENECVHTGEQCVPSSDSKEPWKWTCKL